ncbi:MAG: hypothetical protein Q8R39_03450 [bacterium]|nr:hypothetical protein [bacterium]MDZ4284424.1 hypothetical protein [Patescibacteria group bacterium]
MFEKAGQWVSTIGGGVWGIVLALTALWVLFGPIQKVALDFGVYLQGNWQGLLTAAVILLVVDKVFRSGGS